MLQEINYFQFKSLFRLEILWKLKLVTFQRGVFMCSIYRYICIIPYNMTSFSTIRTPRCCYIKQCNFAVIFSQYHSKSLTYSMNIWISYYELIDLLNFGFLNENTSYCLCLEAFNFHFISFNNFRIWIMNLIWNFF